MGEEVTQALMAEFPARDGDELVTRDFLRAELAELRTELAGLRSRLITIFIAVSGLATTVIIAFG